MSSLKLTTHHSPLITAILILTVSSSASAMTVVQRDFPALVARAEQIIVGTVTDVSEEQDASGAPWTAVTVSDLTVLKGTVGRELTLRFYGGTAGDVAVQVPDMPTFAVGERALLFVAGNGRDVCPLVGIWQGRFRLRFDGERGADVVEDSDYRPVVGRTGRHLARAAAGAASTRPALTLDAMRQLIADELAHPTAENPTP